MKLLYIFPFLENSHSISKYGLESTGVHIEYQRDRQDLLSLHHPPPTLSMPSSLDTSSLTTVWPTWLTDSSKLMKGHQLIFATTTTSLETSNNWNMNLTSYKKNNRTSMDIWCPLPVSNKSYDLSSKPIVYAPDEVVSIHMPTDHLVDKLPQTPPLLWSPLSCCPMTSHPLRMLLHHPKTLSLDPPTFPSTTMLFKVNSRSTLQQHPIPYQTTCDLNSTPCEPQITCHIRHVYNINKHV